MADAFVVHVGGSIVGVYSTRARADRVLQEFAGSAELSQSEIDYPFSRLQAGEKLYLVYFPEVTSRVAVVRQIPLTIRVKENDFRYDSKTRRFDVYVWNLTALGAEQEADVFRQAFVTKNGIS